MIDAGHQVTIDGQINGDHKIDITLQGSGDSAISVADGATLILDNIAVSNGTYSAPTGATGTSGVNGVNGFSGGPGQSGRPGTSAPAILGVGGAGGTGLQVAPLIVDGILDANDVVIAGNNVQAGNGGTGGIGGVGGAGGNGGNASPGFTGFGNSGGYGASAGSSGNSGAGGEGGVAAGAILEAASGAVTLNTVTIANNEATGGTGGNGGEGGPGTIGGNGGWGSAGSTFGRGGFPGGAGNGGNAGNGGAGGAGGTAIGDIDNLGGTLSTHHVSSHDNVAVAGAGGTGGAAGTGGLGGVGGLGGAPDYRFGANGVKGTDGSAGTSGPVGIAFNNVVPCYCRGTRILTERGEVAVEDLVVGDIAITASGERRPIGWIGHRGINTTCHPEPEKVWPVRVLAGAFGEKAPSRDLWMSPGHKVFTQGVLIPVKYLLNGRTVAQVQRPSVEYWHVELDRHDILLADNLPAESYLDTGNRTAFVNGGRLSGPSPGFRAEALGGHLRSLGQDWCRGQAGQGRSVGAGQDLRT